MRKKGKKTKKKKKKKKEKSIWGKKWEDMGEREKPKRTLKGVNRFLWIFYHSNQMNSSKGNSTTLRPACNVQANGFLFPQLVLLLLPAPVRSHVHHCCCCFLLKRVVNFFFSEAAAAATSNRVRSDPLKERNRRRFDGEPAMNLRIFTSKVTEK